MSKELTNLEKQLLKDLPDFSLKGRLLFMRPVKPILRGIFFESSSFDKAAFSVTTFILPLCVPTTHLYLNFGNRIRHTGGGDRWNMTKLDLTSELGAALKLQAVPFLSRVTSLLDFVEIAKAFSQANPNTQRAIAYSLARAGRVSEGVEVLDQLLDQLDTTVPWQLDLAKEATQVRTQLTTNPTEALRQFQAWEHGTERNLGLSEIDGSS
jgi:hypothetical protein